MELEILINKLKAFNKARDWDKDIQPEDLAKSVVIEASELLEHFQWDSTKQHRSETTPRDLETIGDEMADVLIYLLRLTYVMDIDLGEATVRKIEKNGIKYPVNKA